VALNGRTSTESIDNKVIKGVGVELGLDVIDYVIKSRNTRMRMEGGRVVKPG